MCHLPETQRAPWPNRACGEVGEARQAEKAGQFGQGRKTEKGWLGGELGANQTHQEGVFLTGISTGVRTRPSVGYFINAFCSSNVELLREGLRKVGVVNHLTFYTLLVEIAFILPSQSFASLLFCLFLL